MRGCDYYNVCIEVGKFGSYVILPTALTRKVVQSVVSVRPSVSVFTLSSDLWPRLLHDQSKWSKVRVMVSKDGNAGGLTSILNRGC